MLGGSICQEDEGKEAEEGKDNSQYYVREERNIFYFFIFSQGV